MLSNAGKLYQHTKIISPFKTKQRFRSYRRSKVQIHKKQPKLVQPISYNQRQTNNSYTLRYSREINTIANHYPNHQFVLENSPRQIMNKSPVIKYIGQIKDQDYHVDLPHNCDHRCSQANSKQHLTLNLSRASSKLTQSSKLQIQTSSIPANVFQNLSQLNPTISNQKTIIYDQKSTQPSIIKKRSLKLIGDPALDKQIKRINRLKGVSFDSSLGHQYLSEAFTGQKNPQVYQIQKSKESLIRKSMNEPKGYVNFSSFRQKVETRLDRADPQWSSTIQLSNSQINNNKSYNFNKYSQRKKQKEYRYRVNMNLYNFNKNV